MLLLLALACPTDPEPCGEDCLSDLKVILSETVPMGVKANWTAGVDGTCHVVYREEGGDWLQTPPEACGPEARTSAVLRGLHADTAVELEVVLLVEGAEHPRLAAEVHTAPLPEGVPTFDVTVRGATQGWIQGSFSEHQAGVFVLDREGHYVYLWMNEPDQKRDIFNARLAPDHSGFWLVLNEKRVNVGWGLVIKRDWFGDTSHHVEVPYAHHDLLPLGDGTVLVIEGDPDDLDAEVPVFGDRIVQIDPDGSTRPIWSSWDDLTPPTEFNQSTGWYGAAEDWIHANSLAWDPERDTVLLASPHLETLIEVERGSGDLVRMLGNENQGGWPARNPSEAFENPHSAHWTEDGTLLLLSTDWSTEVTSAREYSLDEDAEVLDGVWSYETTDVSAHIAGSVARVPGTGHTLVNYGTGLTLREVDPSGAITWEATLEGTNHVFQAWPVEDLWGDTE